MRKKHYRIHRIPIGEDTPCKICDVFIDQGCYCSGNCRLRLRWKSKPCTIVTQVKEYHITITDGYIYKRSNHKSHRDGSKRDLLTNT